MSQSELIIFSLPVDRKYKNNKVTYEICGCPCHQGIQGHFHCWVDCCEFPNALIQSTLPEAIKRALDSTSRNVIK